MQPNATTEKSTSGINPYKTSAFDQFLTFSALGGLIIDDDGKLNEMKLQQFCELVGIERTMTWRWKSQPGFAEKVRARRAEIVPLARETKAFNQLFLLGMQSQDKRAAVDALKTYLGHFSQLQLPVQRQDIKIQGGLMEVLEAAEADGIIEGEISESIEPDAGSSGQTAGLLPLPS